MYEVKYFIGKFDKDTRKQELSNEYFVSQIIKRLGECTIIRSKGSYLNYEYKMIKEPSLLVIELVDDLPKETAINNCKHFKKIFNQESILFTIQEIEYEVY